MKFPNFRVKGTCAAPLTAMKANGDVNLDTVGQYVDYLVNDHVDNVFLLGTMGEGMSLTVDERKRVAQAWMDAGKGKLKSIVLHIGTTNIRDSMELARHAQSIQVSAIACVSPSFFKPKDEEALVTYMEQVAAAAPDTPFYYYDINFFTGVYLNAARFLELAKDRIPTLVGLKFSSRELPVLYDCKEMLEGRFDILIGTDEQFLPALSLGIEVPVLNSYLGGLYKRLKDAFDKGDMASARKEQAYARKLTTIRDKYGGGPETAKEMMNLLGLEMGPARPPLTPLTPQQVADLHRDLKEAGFCK